MAITRIGNPAIANIREPNFRNIVINGDMSIAQRGTSQASITSGGYYTVDRFKTSIDNLGTWTQSQSTEVPTGQGFAKSLKMDCTTADASPAAGDKLIFAQSIEGQNLQYLKKGTSSAESLTLSFWVKTNKTGTYTLELLDNDNSRSFSQTYTVSSADTWEKKTITYAGDTTGAFGNDNGNSLQCNFWLGAGSNFTSGTFQNSWGSKTAANRVSSSQVNLADSTSNEWYVTGIQLEAGSVASDFEFLPVDVNEQRCQRYYFKTTESGTATILLTGGLESSTSAGQGGFSLPTKMRATPSLSFGSGIKLYSAGSGASTASISQNRCTTTVLSCAATVSGGTVGQAGYIYRATSDGFLVGDAEL